MYCPSWLAERTKKPQHELPLGELVPGAGGLPLQMGFDALEKGFVDLEGHGAVSFRLSAEEFESLA